MELISLSKVDNVTFIDRFNGYAWTCGTLHVTVSHVFFVDDSRRNEIWIQTCLIDEVERLPLKATGAPLVIRGKDFHVACFLIRQDQDCQDIYKTLLRLTYIPTIRNLPCFRNLPRDSEEQIFPGWNLFGLRSDFSRMGVPNSSWVELDNTNFQICDTYPSVLFVPKVANRQILLGSASFRSRKRLPVLTWLHPNGKAALCRSSQPLSGLANKSSDDQTMLDRIRDANPSAPRLYVVDTRPPLNALTNRAQGKGYEDISVYKNIILRFVEIPNIHVVRGSLEKMIKAYQDPKLSLEIINSAIDKSSWLRNLRRIVEAAYFVAARLMPTSSSPETVGNGGYSVLVHCSDGWDRTSQVCSLAQLMIDPYYRTFEGFLALVEKDWLRFGHKFRERCGLVGTGESREVSPIFTQFLDCTRHLLDLLGGEFEFTRRLLLELHDHSRSGLYGTFVGCCERDRIDLGLANKTPSLWAYLIPKKQLYLNPLYSPPTVFIEAKKTTPRPHVVSLIPDFILSPHLFVPWSDLYLRREWRIPNISQVMTDTIDDLHLQTGALAAHSALLQKRISALHRLMSTSPDDTESSKTYDEHGPYSNQNDVFDDLDHPSDKLTAEQIVKEIGSVNTQQFSLVPDTTAICDICHVLLASRTPCLHCVQCGLHVCSSCYILNGKPQNCRSSGGGYLSVVCKTCYRLNALNSRSR